MERISSSSASLPLISCMWASASAFCAIRLADDEGSAGVVAHHSRFGDFRRRVHDAAENVPRVERREQLAARIQAVDRPAVEAPAFLEEIPPGQAVDRGNHRGFRPDQGFQPRQHRGDRMGLEADEDRVLRAEIGRIVRCGNGKDRAVSVREERKPVSAQRLKMGAAGDEAHLVPCPREPRPDEPAYGAGADDADPHFYTGDRPHCLRGSAARMNSLTAPIWSSLFSHGAWPIPANSTSLTRGPPSCIRRTVDLSSRSDCAPRSTRVGHSTVSHTGQRLTPKRKSLPNSTPAFPPRRRVLTIAGPHASVYVPSSPLREPCCARRLHCPSSSGPNEAHVSRKWRSTSSRFRNRAPAPEEPSLSRTSACQGSSGPTSFSTRRRIGELGLAASIIPIRPPIEVPIQSILGPSLAPCSRRRRETLYGGGVSRASSAAESERYCAKP